MLKQTCGHRFLDDYPESRLGDAQELQYTLLRSGYQAKIWKRQALEGAASRMPPFSQPPPPVALENTALDDQPSDGLTATLQHKAVGSLNLADSVPGPSKSFKVGSDEGLDNQSSPSFTVSARDQTYSDDGHQDSDSESFSQWLLLCFHHNQYVSRTTHAVIQRNAPDTDLIRQFRSEYTKIRGKIAFFVPWRKVTGIRLVTVSRL